MKEICAEQPTVQSEPQCGLSVDHIPVRERKWEDISANEFSHKHVLGCHISKIVGNWYLTNIARTEKQMVLFIGD